MIWKAKGIQPQISFNHFAICSCSVLRGCCHVVIPAWDFSWGTINKCLLTMSGGTDDGPEKLLCTGAIWSNILLGWLMSEAACNLWGEAWARGSIQGHGCLAGRGVTEKSAPPWTWSVKAAVLWPCTAFSSSLGYSLYCPWSLRKKGPCELDTFHRFTDTCGLFASWPSGVVQILSLGLNTTVQRKLLHNTYSCNENAMWRRIRTSAIWRLISHRMW